MLERNEQNLNHQLAMYDDIGLDLLNLLNNPDKRLSQNEAISFLHNQNAFKYFKFHIDEYCELYRFIIVNVKDHNEYMNFTKNENINPQILKEKEFCSTFLEIATPALIETCYKFMADENVIEETSRVLQKCIFSFKEFECYLTDLFENRTCPEKHSPCKILLKFFLGLNADSKLLGLGLKLFLHSFSKTFKSFSYSYKMFLVLLDTIGFEVRGQFNFSKIKYQIKEPVLFESMDILNQLLDVVTKLNIDLEYKISDITFSIFLKKLLVSIISLTKTPNVYSYQIFLKVVEMDPMIVESLICEIITYVMLSDSKTCIKESENLMIKIFEVYHKLHRIQNLIAKMIPIFKSDIGNWYSNKPDYAFRGNVYLEVPTNVQLTVNNLLSEVVLNYFTNCITSLASWQVVNLLKTLLYHLNKAVEEVLEIKEEIGYLPILSNVTCSLLLGIRIASHINTPSALTKFTACLEELRRILGNFGTMLLQKEHDHMLMTAFLNISYYWADVYMTLEYYQENSDFKMIKNEEGNFSLCNLSCLHPYLSDKEWCLISERINNFGQKPCKEIMHKLMIQLLKACVISGNNVTNTEEIAKLITRTLSSDFDPCLFDICTDQFVINNILCKMPSTFILSFTEYVLENLIEGNTKMINQPYIYHSELIIKGILTKIFEKISKLLKQKRKHNDVIIRKAVCARAITVLPPEMYLVTNVYEFIPEILEILSSENNEQYIDLKMNEYKIDLLLQVLMKLPIYLCTEDNQKLLVLLLFSLHKDAKNSICKHITKKCEILIINIIEQNKLILLDICDNTFLLKTIVNYFDGYEQLFYQITQTIFKSDAAIRSFEPIVTFIKNNLKEERCLKVATFTLNILIKVKKNKLSTELKELCSKYKFDICQKMVKWILKNEAEDSLVESYALILKIYIAKDEDNTFSRLQALLPNYIDHCLTNLSDMNVKESLMLFSTVLHNKIVLCNVSEDFTWKLWTALNTVTINNSILEEYSQLTALMATLVSNEEFLNIFEDLLKSTEKSINSADEKEFYKHLKTWSSVLTTNFNTFKMNILREQLEFLLNKLVLRLKIECYKDELFEEIIQFEVSIIQANHVALTTTLMDFVLLSSSVLLKQSNNYSHNLGLSLLLLENLLKYRKPLIIDRLPPYLAQYRALLKELCLKNYSNLIFQLGDIGEITDCAHKLEKLTRNLVECAKDMGRIAMFLIADILGQYELYIVHPNIKKHLNNCIYSLISICDHHAIQYLMRVLSNASTEIFKIMYESYKKHYRFTGKI